jgi:ATP sulfurylase
VHAKEDASETSASKDGVTLLTKNTEQREHDLTKMHHAIRIEQACGCVHLIVGRVPPL